MAKIKLAVPKNLTLRRDDRIFAPATHSRLSATDEIERWLRHGYAQEVEAQKRSTKRK